MVSEIINFYRYANQLKYKIRTGWLEIGIEKERLESVAEHIFGTLILAIGIESEYDLNLDMYKILKMLALHELEEVLMPDYTIRSNVTYEEKVEKGKVCVHKVTEGLLKQKEIEDLLNEFNKRESKEAIFCYLIDKIECDFQAKIYDLEGVMDFDRTKKDLEYMGNRAEEIKQKSKNASDFWLEFDKPKFEKDEIFKRLIEEIQQCSILESM